MGQIFEREFRREKTLEQAKKQQEKKGPSDNAKAQAQKDKIAEKLVLKLKEIESTFFDEVIQKDL